MRKTFHRLKKILDLNYANSFILGVLGKPFGRKKKKIKKEIFLKNAFFDWGKSA